MVLEDRVEFIRNVNDELVPRGIDAKPFDATFEMISFTYELVKDIDIDSLTDMNRARAIYYWMGSNVSRELNPKNVNSFRDVERVGYFHKSGSEAFALRKGMCVDMAYLYTTLAKIANIKSGIANVYVDSDGDDEDHMCSWIEWLDNTYLIDITRNHGFGAKHKRFSLMEDHDAREFYNNYSRNYNLRNWEAVMNYSGYSYSSGATYHRNNFGTLSKITGILGISILAFAFSLESCDVVSGDKKIITPFIEELFDR